MFGTHTVRYSCFIEEFGTFEFDGGSIPVRQSGYKSYVQTDKPVYKPGQPVRWVAVAYLLFFHILASKFIFKTNFEGISFAIN